MSHIPVCQIAFYTLKGTEVYSNQSKFKFIGNVMFLYEQRFVLFLYLELYLGHGRFQQIFLG